MAVKKPRKLIPRSKLTRCREQVKLSQRELAVLAGCTPATISDIETGRNRTPAHDKVVGIVRALRSRGCTEITANDCFPVAFVPRAVAATIRPAARKRAS